VLQVERIVNDVRYRLPMAPVVMEDAADIDRLWALRKALLPTIRGFHPTMKPLSVVNDVGVPVDLLATFIERVQETFDALGLHAAIYGHAGSGNLHLRPLFDITDPGLDAKIRDTADRIYELVCAFGGTITAEHGMGPLRAPYLEAEWGPEIVGFMRRVKQLFDPEGVLNPGAMFPLRSITDRRSPLRVPRR
jgi:FAD/FMN-containing dehydrogenase